MKEENAGFLKHVLFASSWVEVACTMYDLRLTGPDVYIHIWGERSLFGYTHYKAAPFKKEIPKGTLI